MILPEWGVSRFAAALSWLKLWVLSDEADFNLKFNPQNYMSK